MKISISNIAWSEENDDEMFQYMMESGFDALEVAPTRIIKENPYSHIIEAKKFAESIEDKYGLKISSMQSIWYGRQEKIFGTGEERGFLTRYTRLAIDFASEIGCKNLVFGCPKNRSTVNDNLLDWYKFFATKQIDMLKELEIAIDFFNIIGYYAESKNTYISIEANPVIYNTNFLNTTEDAIRFVSEIQNPGIKLNLDLGTMIYNNEALSILKDNVRYINHVHISEPNLECIQSRDIHKELIKLLKEENYKGYISIEMKNQNNIIKVKEVMDYIKEIVKKYE